MFFYIQRNSKEKMNFGFKRIRKNNCGYITDFNIHVLMKKTAVLVKSSYHKVLLKIGEKKSR